MDENRISGLVTGAAIAVHRVLGPGLLESTCQQCLARALELRGIPLVRECPSGVDYKGLTLDRAYRIDFLVTGQLVVALKTVDTLEPVHRSQLLTYLKWSETRLGLSINFNVRILKSGSIRVINSP